jgi:hypothetical protein
MLKDRSEHRRSHTVNHRADVRQGPGWQHIVLCPRPLRLGLRGTRRGSGSGASSCRRAIQEDADRLRYILVPPVAFSMWSLGGPHGAVALASLTVALVVAKISTTLQRRWCFSELVAGLDRVKPWDMKGRRRILAILVLVGLVYCWLVAWQILRAMQANAL